MLNLLIFSFLLPKVQDQELTITHPFDSHTYIKWGVPNKIVSKLKLKNFLINSTKAIRQKPIYILKFVRGFNRLECRLGDSKTGNYFAFLLFFIYKCQCVL